MDIKESPETDSIRALRAMDGAGFMPKIAESLIDGTAVFVLSFGV